MYFLLQVAFLSSEKKIEELGVRASMMLKMLWRFESLKGGTLYYRILVRLRRGLEISRILFQGISYLFNSLIFRLSLDPRNGHQLPGGVACQ